MPNEWYTIQTLSGQEMKAEKSLRKRIVEEEMDEYIDEILLPMEKVVEVRGGKKTVSQRKLYPGYLFIKMKVYDEERRLLPLPWDFIRNTVGLIGFLGDLVDHSLRDGVMSKREREANNDDEATEGSDKTCVPSQNQQ